MVLPEAAIQANRNMPDRRALAAMEHSWDDWKTRGACHNNPRFTTEDFYPPGLVGRPTEEKARAFNEQIEILRSLCASCPVFNECEELGLVEPYGFLAGRTEDERAREKDRRKRARYRARKEDGLVEPGKRSPQSPY